MAGVLLIAVTAQADAGADRAKAVEAAIRYHFRVTQPYISRAVFDGRIHTPGGDAAEDARAGAELDSLADAGVVIADLAAFGTPTTFRAGDFRNCRSEDAAFWVLQPVFVGTHAQVDLIVWQRNSDGPVRLRYTVECANDECRVSGARTF
jgi:hypothetical protein